MENYFGIGMVGLPEVSAQGLELGANRRMIVDLAIEDHPDATILIAHGLVGGRGEIDD
jgi:hypothetical protein